MGHRRPKKPPVVAGDPTDPHGMAALLERFLEWMRLRAYSEQTVINRHKYLSYFIGWSEERGITRASEVTKPVLERYQRYLYHYRKKNGQPLSFRSQYSRLVPVRAFFKWLTRNNHILYNPASELELPRLRPRLPKSVLSEKEAEQVLAQADVSEPLGIRDRAIMETLYSTGMRRMELVNLQLYDIDVERGTVMVQQGKGKKDRMIPIGQRALDWIDCYLVQVRPLLTVAGSEQTVFLTREGEAFTPDHLTNVVKAYVEGSGINKRGSCHLFRHTMATLMLENGADIRFIQQMLGHASLSTTQIYTQVSIRKLKQIHTATHPAKDKRQDDGGRGTEANGEAFDAAAESKELLSSLAAEAEQEDR